MIIKNLSRYALLGLVAMTLPTCKKLKNPTEGVVQIVDATFTKATAAFKFVDANTGILVDSDGTAKIQVSISGKNASDIVDNLGGSVIAAGNGYMALALREGVVPSQSNRIEFNIHATATGYLPVDKAVTVYEEGHTSYVIQLMKISNLPAGIVAKQQNISNVPTTGITATENIVTTAAVSGSGTNASLTIPTGTKLMDKDNKPVSGTVSTTLAYFDPTTPGAASMFNKRGGLIEKSADGDYIEFNPAAGVSTEMRGGGKEVKNFGQSIQMTVGVPDGTRNATGGIVKAGDKLDVFSYDVSKGAWVNENQKVTVILNNTTGKLETTFEMKHLSEWIVTDFKKHANEPSHEITIVGSCFNYLSGANELEVYGECEYSYHFVKQVNVSVPKSGKMYLPKLESHEMRYKIKHIPSNTIVNINVPSSTSTVTTPSTWCPEGVVDFDILLTSSCPSNPGRLIKPQCTVYALEEGKLVFFDFIEVGQMVSGKITTNTGLLKKGKKYSLWAIYNSKPVCLTGELAGFKFNPREITGETLDLSRPMTSAECTYLSKITG